MSLALLLVRLALALIFAIAAAGKLSDLDGTRRTIEQFGLPRWAARPAARALPVAELVVALGLLFGATAGPAAIAAAALLSLFCLAIASVMARGEAPECNCFGSLGSARIGLGTLIRNAVLLALAAFVVVAGREQAGASAFAWTGANPALAALAIAVTGAMVAQAAFSWQLFKQNGRLLVRIADLEERPATSGALDDGPPIGAPAPDFVLPDLDGRRVGLDELLADGRGALLLFTDPGCAHCTPLLPAFAAAQAGGVPMPVAVIGTGEPAANHPKATEHGIGQILLQDGFAVADQFGLHGAPAAAVIDERGRITAQRAQGARAVRSLIDSLSLPPDVLSAAPRTERHEAVGVR